MPQDLNEESDQLAIELAAVVEATATRSPNSGARRLLDLVISVPLAIVTVPLVLVLASVSACTFRAWPFFVHWRVGQHGRHFRFAKIRSMPADIPDYIDKYALSKRLTSGWGLFIRGTHLDELPQLWHVVTGKMSLVGPRPEMVPLAGRFDPTFGRVRVLVRPGCTGLWQVSSANDRLIGEAPGFDLFYLRNATARLDLWVLWRTLRDAVPGGDAIDLGDVPWRYCGIDPSELRRCQSLQLPPAWRRRGEPERDVGTTVNERVERRVTDYSSVGQRVPQLSSGQGS